MTDVFSPVSPSKMWQSIGVMLVSLASLGAGSYFFAHHGGSGLAALHLADETENNSILGREHSHQAAKNLFIAFASLALGGLVSAGLAKKSYEMAGGRGSVFTDSNTFSD